MTDKQMDEVLSGVPDAAREFNEKRHGADGLVVVQAELSTGLSDEERAHVKSSLITLIDEVREASGFSGTLVDKLNAVSAAACALVCLCDGAGGGVDAAAVAAGLAARAPRDRRSRR